MLAREGAACGVKRLGREQGLDDEAGVQGERVGQRELLLLDRKDAASEGGPAPACDAHWDLPGAVHVTRDADVHTKTRGGALQRRPLFLGGLRRSGNQ
jgi:hypothetical protein